MPYTNHSCGFCVLYVPIIPAVLCSPCGGCLLRSASTANTLAPCPKSAVNFSRGGTRAWSSGAPGGQPERARHMARNSRKLSFPSRSRSNSSIMSRAMLVGVGPDARCAAAAAAAASAARRIAAAPAASRAASPLSPSDDESPSSVPQGAPSVCLNSSNGLAASTAARRRASSSRLSSIFSADFHSRCLRCRCVSPSGGGGGRTGRSNCCATSNRSFATSSSACRRSCARSSLRSCSLFPSSIPSSSLACCLKRAIGSNAGAAATSFLPCFLSRFCVFAARFNFFSRARRSLGVSRGRDRGTASPKRSNSRHPGVIFGTSRGRFRTGISSNDSDSDS
eukprot:Hpha_TRINITY_DN6896_c0_g1::TRINITY_DN6896_c0_g1_i1::g.46175::m.46175